LVARRAAPRRRLCGIALGSNLGPSREILAAAIAELERRFGPLRVAPFYRTQAVTAAPQPDFWNTVVLARTALGAEALLAELQEVERRFGRIRPQGETGAPRTLDLDLLFLGNRVRRRRPPLLPHPRMRDRRFVLAPLADLEPELPLPPDGTTVRAALASLPDRPWVRRVRQSRSPRTART
jgi:2-amino-4-hydroxy-6-hydroxymethyldihydropteridine diphosphokinase